MGWESCAAFSPVNILFQPAWTGRSFVLPRICLRNSPWFPQIEIQPGLLWSSNRVCREDASVTSMLSVWDSPLGDAVFLELVDGPQPMQPHHHKGFIPHRGWAAYGETLNLVWTSWPCRCSNVHQTLLFLVLCPWLHPTAPLGELGMQGKAGGRTLTPGGQTLMDLRSSARFPTARGGWMQNPPWHDAPETTGGASGPPSPGIGRVNINHTESAQAWVMQSCPLGWAAAPSAIPSKGKSWEHAEEPWKYARGCQRLLPNTFIFRHR